MSLIWVAFFILTNPSKVGVNAQFFANKINDNPHQQNQSNPHEHTKTTFAFIFSKTQKSLLHTRNHFVAQKGTKDKLLYLTGAISHREHHLCGHRLALISGGDNWNLWMGQTNVQKNEITG